MSAGPYATSFGVFSSKCGGRLICFPAFSSTKRWTALLIFNLGKIHIPCIERGKKLATRKREGIQMMGSIPQTQRTDDPDYLGSNTSLPFTKPHRRYLTLLCLHSLSCKREARGSRRLTAHLHLSLCSSESSPRPLHHHHPPPTSRPALQQIACCPLPYLPWIPLAFPS